MTQAIIEAVNNFFGNAWITTFVLSMIPLVELKGAIPFGVHSGLSVFSSFLMAYLGSTLIFVPLYFLLRPILNLLKRVKWFRLIALKVEYLFERKAGKIVAKGSREGGKISAKGIMMIGVFGFVAVPVPLTGVWTGTAVAVFLGLKFWDSAFAVALGNLVAGTVIALLSWLFEPYLDYVILALAAVALALLVVFIIKVVRCKLPKEEDSCQNKD